jgi:hypothetical protein
MKKYADGGIYTAEMGKPPTDPEGVPASKKPAPKAPAPKKTAPPKDTVFREGMPVPQDIDGASVKKMAKGGSASSRADGCATKGKTKGTMITMRGGGYAC